MVQTAALVRTPSLAAAFALVLSVVVPASASAVEFRLDGYYRFRANLFDTLSLDRDHADTEGVRTYLEHRLLLSPQLRVNSNVHVFLDVDVMDALRFGSNPEILQAIGAVNSADGTAFNEPLGLSGSVLPGSDYRESVFVRRAWAELYTKYVDLKVGRMGSHFGMGLVANDGRCDTCEYGDTVDRVMVSTSALDPARISVAFDTRAEGWINRADDTHSFLFTGGYLGEVHKGAVWVRWTRQPSNGLNIANVNLWGATQLGPLSIEGEGVFIGGRADSTDIGVEDLEILQGGGAFKVGLQMNPVDFGVHFGFASGDTDHTDTRWTALRMDRDHDVGMLMFEHAMPQFARGAAADAENQNIDTSRAITGEGVTNAFYIVPSVHVEPIDNVRLGVSLTAAFPLIRTVFDATDEAGAYGAEIGFNGSWTIAGAFEIGGRAAIFIPGDVFGTGLAPTVGAELRALVHF